MNWRQAEAEAHRALEVSGADLDNDVVSHDYYVGWLMFLKGLACPIDHESYYHVVMGWKDAESQYIGIRLDKRPKE